MDRLELQKRTKYLAKRYLDRYLTLKEDFEENSTLLLVITCMRVATKFNQPHEISSQYTIQVCLNQAANSYQPNQFLQFQHNLVLALQFRLQMVTPFDIDPDRYQLTLDQLQLLNQIINFSLTIPEISLKSCEEIFNCCLLYVYKQKPGSMDTQLIENRSCRGQLDRMCEKIESYLDELGKQ